MSTLTKFSSARVRKQQVFTSSGTFVPSARLLELGGWVEVMCVGGGGGGWTSGYVRRGGAGGSVTRKVVQVTGNVTVTVGAGGAGVTSPTSPAGEGGSSSFGSLVSAWGGRGASQYTGGEPDWYSYGIDGSGAGASGQGTRISGSGFVHGAGGPGYEGFGCGGAGSTSTLASPVHGPSNSGHGGSFGGNGGSGIVIVEWWE